MNSEELARLLSEALNADRLPHALLLAGDTQASARLASEVTQGLLCRETNRPCGVCESCLKVRSGLHPDVLPLEPELKKAVSIAQVRELVATLSQNAGGNARVAWVRNMAQLSTLSQNALLKLLEEPPESVYWILCGQETDVLPTVRSRCFVLRLGESAAYAEPPGALEAFLTLHEKNANPWDSEGYWLEQKAQADELLRAWMLCAHDMLRLRVEDGAPIAHEFARRRLSDCAAHFTTRQIHAMIERLWEAEKRLQANANHALLGQWLLLGLLEDQ